MIRVSVADVRAALARVSASTAAGLGEPATLLLGRIFHEVFADLASIDPLKSGLRVIAESGGEVTRRNEQLLDHAWHRLLAPRLRRHAAVLQDSTAQVLTTWRATQSLTKWLGSVVWELIEQTPGLRGDWERLERYLRAEVPLSCELCEPGWSEPVELVGFADSVLRPSENGAFCAIELKLGRAAPTIDLGQAALYHLMLSRTAPKSSRRALALLRFSPDLEEHVFEPAALGPALARLLDLIGRLAGVVREDGSTSPPANANASASHEPRATAPEQRATGLPPAVTPAEPAGAAGPIEASSSSRYDELGKRLVRAYREHGVGVELRSAPQVGPRFLRFDVRLTPGMKVDRVRKLTREVQHRLELGTEPLIVQEAGHLFIDLERPDPNSVFFSAVAERLPPSDPLHGSARLLIGVDAANELRLADLGSSGRTHVLAAGTTGSGKSEWLRTALASLIARNTPDTLRIVTFDPKLAAFNELERSPFLWRRDAFWIQGSGAPASELFRDLIEEMERRYQLTRQSGSDNLRAHVEKTRQPLARIVCVCDEYYSLVAQNKHEKEQIEEAVALLSAKARAAGIHLILATQQPSRAIINGVIQSNLPCRVALSLGSEIESRMILGKPGAERLTGSGDLLYKDFGEPVRLQAPLLEDQERRRYFA